MIFTTVLFTNFLPPYRIPLFKALTQKLGKFQIFISTKMEADRLWKPSWENLTVQVQKNWTIHRKWHHPHGFSENNYLHIPYDTLPVLFQIKPQVIISAEMGMRTAQAVLYRKLNPSCRLIIWATLSEHTEQGRGKAREFLRRVLLPRADAVIVNGQSGSRYIQRFGFPENKIFKIPQTTEISPFLAIPIQESSNKTIQKILYAGRLIELKGLLPFLEDLAAHATEKSNQRFEFWLAGDGPLRGDIEKFSLPSNLTLRLLGEIKYDELSRVYSQVDALVLPTLSDEWGLVIIEALAAGLPVLGSIFSQAVEELIQTGINGWTFNPLDRSSCKSAIADCFGTESERITAMKKNARKTVENLTPDFVASKICAVIESVSPENSVKT